MNSTPLAKTIDKATRSESRDEISSPKIPRFPRETSSDICRSDRSIVLSCKHYWLERGEQLPLRVPGQWNELPDARASTLDLSVLRSSRIARNSSYFVLIREFVPVRLPRFHQPSEPPRAISFPVSSASSNKLVSPTFLRPLNRTFHRYYTDYLRTISSAALIEGN